MCVVSAVGDYYGQRWPQQYPEFVTSPSTFTSHEVTRFEFDALKREVERVKQLLLTAKAVDEANGEADCHKDEKVEIVRRFAEIVGVDLEDVLG